MAVSDNERKIDKLRKDNEEWRQKLHELQMQTEGEENKKKVQFTPELTKLDGEIQKQQRELEKASIVSKKVQMVNDQVNSWTSRAI